MFTVGLVSCQRKKSHTLCFSQQLRGISWIINVSHFDPKKSKKGLRL